MAISLSDAAQALLDCVCNALADDLRPVCKCYQTQGTPVIFTCCECEDGTANGELSIHLRRLFDADSTTLEEVQRVRPCRGGVTAAQYRLVLARCRPVINEKGELPDEATLTEFANDQIRDIELTWQAIACCTGMNVKIDDLSVDLSEPGMCSIFYVDVTLAVVVPALPTDSSA